MKHILYYKTMSSPIGKLHIIADDKNLRFISFNKNFLKKVNINAESLSSKKSSIIEKTIKQIKQYFALKRKSFELPITFSGTLFQNKTWNALKKIPYGKTICYQQQAKMIKNPKAARAIGRANGMNPLSIVIPCHRVIGKSGNLIGFGGGLSTKKYLLKLENAEIFNTN